MLAAGLITAEDGSATSGIVLAASSKAVMDKVTHTHTAAAAA